MRSRWKSCLVWIGVGLFALLGLCLGAYLLLFQGRPAPVPVKHKLYEGVTYYRKVRFLPRLMVAHVLIVDTRLEGIRFLVTPPADDGQLRARTTSQFLDEFDLQIAVNGDGFYPWHSYSPADYYPHVGDAVTPNGYAASLGKPYSDGNEPTLFISRRNGLSFNKMPGRVYNAISGDRMLVLQGQPVEGLDNVELDPRTAVGINKNGRWLILVMVDGRQPFYSQGATFMELAEILMDNGAYFAMNLDGGGSATMVIAGPDGGPQILNSPIDNYIPGRERPVANHLGIYIRE